MAHAICTECGTPVHWKAGKGRRLADLKCPSCGGTLRPATVNPNPVAKGRRYHICTVCGRRTLYGGEAAVPLRLLYEGWRIKIIPVGAWVCPDHKVLPVNHPYWDLQNPSPETVMAWIDEIEAWTQGPCPPEMSEREWEWYRALPEHWRGGEMGRYLANTVRDVLLRARGISMDPPPSIWTQRSTRQTT